MGAFLELIATERIDVDGLILARVPVERAAEAYERLLSSEVSPLGIVLHYDSTPAPARTRTNSRLVAEAPASWNVANVIGTGSFAQRVLIPGLKAAGIELRSAASARGLSARAAVEQFGFAHAVTPQEAVTDTEAGLVAIATRHASHATLAEAALLSGKAVFVEKPPALTEDELARLRDARASSGRPLFVGFNRRFAPLARHLTEHVRATSSPIELLVRVSAGRLAGDHWLNDPEDGGGRLLGEGCHFVDFACWVVGSPVSRVSCSMSREPGIPLASSQGFSVTLEFSDHSLATILYTARGAGALAKEYVEAHAAGRSAVLDDFRSLRLLSGRKVERKSSGKQDKGHRAQLAHLREVLGAGMAMSEPDPLDSMDVTLEAAQAACGGADVASCDRRGVQPPNGRVS
jgi:polar amino acid transport system substrate-binding protein